MRVLHLSTFAADSGAARGSLWLHQALRRRAVDSVMMVGDRGTGDRNIHRLPGRVAQIAAKLRMRLDRLPLRRYRKTDDSFWTIGWLPERFDRLVDHLQPDIVHLHWVGAGFMPVHALAQFRCPIVWTLRDMWGFTGGCHYTAGCERYRDACGACPQLRSEDQNDLSRAIWNRKRRHWQDLDLWVVPISRWLGDCARDSALFNRYPIEVIPNGLDTGLFRVTRKQAAREAWGLPQDRRIVVYGAINAMKDRRKGFPELLDALRQLHRFTDTGKVMLVLFGDLQPGDIPDTGIEIRHVGFLNDNRRLSELYSSADVAVMPSIQEAFGKTLMEAMACGTPVVAFEGGGPDDIVDHRVDGYLARPYEAEDLARGIAWSLDEISGGRDLGAAARCKVETRFDIDVVAAQYHDLYTRVLAGAGRQRQVA